MRRGVERLRREVADRLPLGPNGIVRGAEPITLDGDPARAVLVVHGFGDAPDSLQGLAAHLHRAGWTVRAPLLPGHGRTLDDFARSRADGWIAHARAAYAALRATHPHVAVVGLSMGGAIAAILAAESPPPALVLLAPYVAMPRHMRLAAALHPLVTLAAPWIVSRNPRSIRDPAARVASRGYGVVAPRLLPELATVVARARRALPRITSPTRVVASRLDNRVPAAAAAAAFARLGAATKELVWLEESGHVITVDVEKARVFDLVGEWIERA
ncbi:MAG: alpha/beta fold hydrolase [Gemmatirosa sp.]|nr:alpha/beta fold hydrolase [Gemmatirosa sp.]